MKKWLCLFVLTIFISVMGFFNVSVEAVSAYKTYTVDRNNQLMETNEAYEAFQMIRTLSDGSTLNAAKDLVIDSEDYLYIADTGNKRIVILNPSYQVIHSFGSDRLIKPQGVTILNDIIYVADYGYGQQASDLGWIHLYHYDKTKLDTEEAITWLDSLSTPSSPILERDQFVYRPLKIAVDQNQTMYVVNEGTTSGVLMINSENRFINYFASNRVEISLWERLERILYQNNEDVYLTKNIPSPVLNIATDPSGYFYTVTQKQTTSGLGDNIKKVNIGGVNYYQDKIRTFSDIVDVVPGTVGNLYAVTSAGFIAEYDNVGNLLFLFGGRGTGRDKLGLFLSASAIAMDSKNQLYVIDDHASRNSIQIFRQTPFAEQVHLALDLYNQAKYDESIALWNEVLRYNSMLDLAYRGKGLGEMMNENYEVALELFWIARDQANYSEAFWELRNLWMIEHGALLFWVVFALIALILFLPFANKKWHLIPYLKTKLSVVSRVVLLKETLYFFRFLSHPADTCYEIKAHKRIRMRSAWLYLFLLFGLYLLGIVLTGFIFNPYIPEETILIKEALVILLPILLFIVSNYLMSSLMEGEGTFQATFTTTIGSLTPVFILYPLAIILSNMLSYSEGFLYSMTLFLMAGWVVILLFFVVKETQNYTVGQTLINLLLSLLTMVVLIVVLLMVYLMIAQVFNFSSDILKELILRE